MDVRLFLTMVAIALSSLSIELYAALGGVEGRGWPLRLFLCCFDEGIVKVFDNANIAQGATCLEPVK